MSPTGGAARHDPVLQAVIRSAVGATGATQGWVLRAGEDGLRVEAAAGDVAGLVGAAIDVAGSTAGYVVASGQPLAMAPGPDSAAMVEGAARLLRRWPANVLSVPCSTEASVIGALELFDKAGGGNFSFDDIELATLLAGIAAEALAHGGGGTTAVPDPAFLGGELARLAAADPDRYAALASVVSALLGHG